MRFAILEGAGMRRLSPQNVGGDVSIVNKTMYNADTGFIDDFKMVEQFGYLCNSLDILAADIVSSILSFI